MPVTPPPPRPGRSLRRLGWAVLLLGLMAAAIVFVRADRAQAAAAGYRIVAGQTFGTGGDDTATERLGGRALIRTAAFDRWLRSWFEGRRLAATLAMLSLAVGGGCLHLAGLAAEGGDKGGAEGGDEAGGE